MTTQEPTPIAKSYRSPGAPKSETRHFVMIGTKVLNAKSGDHLGDVRFDGPRGYYQANEGASRDSTLIGNLYSAEIHKQATERNSARIGEATDALISLAELCGSDIVHAVLVCYIRDRRAVDTATIADYLGTSMSATRKAIRSVQTHPGCLPECDTEAGTRNSHNGTSWVPSRRLLVEGLLTLGGK